MATTLALEPARYSSGTREVRIFPEAASQSFKTGEFVELNTNSQVNSCASGDVLTIGIAQGDATGVTNADCEVLLANDDTTFEMTISGGSDPTFAITDMGVLYALLVANNRSLVNVDDATDNDLFTIIGLKQSHDAGINIEGDDYVRAYVKVLPDTFQLGGGGESA